MPKTNTLKLTSGESISYKPLPVLGGVDEYLETYSAKLLDSGVFDTLSYNGAGMDLKSADFATFGLIGRALVEVIVQSDDEAKPTQGSALKAVLLDHCERFNAQLDIGDGKLVPLNSVDAINEHVDDIGVLFEIVGRLAWSVFGPLFTRLNSFAEARRETSATRSNETSPAS